MKFKILSGMIMHIVCCILECNGMWFGKDESLFMRKEMLPSSAARLALVVVVTVLVIQ
jgi:hypothetical protein